MRVIQIPARGLIPGMIFRLTPEATARYLVLRIERRERTDDTVHLTVQFLANNAISTEVLWAEEDLVYAGTIFSHKSVSQIRAEYPALIGQEVLEAQGDRVLLPLQTIREVVNEVIRNTQADPALKGIRAGASKVYDLLARRVGRYNGFVLRAPVLPPAEMALKEKVGDTALDTTWRTYT